MAGLLAIVLLPSTALATVPHKAITQAENVSVFITADSRVIDMTGDEPTEESEELDRPICSGSILASDGTDEVILTAKHCTESTVESFSSKMLMLRDVHFFDGDVGHVKAIYKDQELDVALLLVHSMRKHKDHIQLANHLGIGEPLFVYGMPHGFFWSLSTATAMNGNVEFSPDPPVFKNFLQIECMSCYGGNSGGAVFNMKGQVVGVFSARGPNSFWMTSYSRINRMINQLMTK